MTAKKMLIKEILSWDESQAKAILDMIKAFGVQKYSNCPELIDENVAKEKNATSQNDILGLFADCPELMDQIVEEAMQAREHMPLRLRDE